jgi:hypothetical protein
MHLGKPPLEPSCPPYGPHFADHLSSTCFTSDAKKLASELKALRRIVRHYYSNKSVVDTWQCILLSRPSEFLNICILVSAVMVVAVSNSFVESRFSFLTVLLPDRRLSIGHATMTDLLLIRANHLV